MLSQIIKDWLAEYKTIQQDGLQTYSEKISKDSKILPALCEFFQAQKYSHEELDPVCHQLFEFYRTRQDDLQRFTLEFVPDLISTYLCAVGSQSTKKNSTAIEACLLEIYNLEIVNKDGSSKMETITIPTLAKSSIYHEPGNLGTLALTESALSRYKGEAQLLTSGPFPQVERLIAQNRFLVLSYIMKCYNSHISQLSHMSHQALCLMASRICTRGFFIKTRKHEARIAVNGQFLVELLHGIYFVMFNGSSQLGMQAVEDVHFRANHDLLPYVLLVTNAIMNYMEVNPSGQPMDGPMGLSVAVSPSTSSYVISQSAITNATFKLEKVPDEEDQIEDPVTSPKIPNSSDQAITDLNKDSRQKNEKISKQSNKRQMGKKQDKSKSKDIVDYTGNKKQETDLKSANFSGEVTEMELIKTVQVDKMTDRESPEIVVNGVEDAVSLSNVNPEISYSNGVDNQETNENV